MLAYSVKENSLSFVIIPRVSCVRVCSESRIEKSAKTPIWLLTSLSQAVERSSLSKISESVAEFVSVSRLAESQEKKKKSNRAYRHLIHTKV